MSARKRSKFSIRRRLKRLLLVLILLGGLLFALDYKGVISLPFGDDEKPAATPSSDTDEINYDPPTSQEKAETEEFKEGLGEQAAPPATPSTTNSAKKSVTPIMTSWSASPNVEVRGYVPGINEEGGTCTLTLTKSGQKVTESKEATPDAKTVSCGLISIARTRLTPGAWSATLSYSSASSEGTSTSNSIEVE